MKLYQVYHIESRKTLFYFGADDREAVSIADETLQEMADQHGVSLEWYDMAEVTLEPLPAINADPALLSELRANPGRWEMYKIRDAASDSEGYQLLYYLYRCEGAIVYVGSGSNGEVYWYEDCKTPLDVFVAHLAPAD